MRDGTCLTTTTKRRKVQFDELVIGTKSTEMKQQQNQITSL